MSEHILQLLRCYFPEVVHNFGSRFRGDIQWTSRKILQHHEDGVWRSQPCNMKTFARIFSNVVWLFGIGVPLFVDVIPHYTERANKEATFTCDTRGEPASSDFGCLLFELSTSFRKTGDDVIQGT